MAQIDDWIDAIQNSTNQNIDKDQLTCAARLFHDCGLKKKEVPGLQVGNVDQDENGNPVALNVGRPEKVDIPQEAQPAIRRCMESVAASGGQSDLLLPKYSQSRTLDRHLKATLEVGFDEIRKAGMKDAQERGERWKDIAQRFGISERSVEDSVQKRIQPAGKPKPDEWDHLFKEWDDIPLIDTIEELKSKKAEIQERLKNCSSRHVLEQMASWKKLFAMASGKRWKELTIQETAANQENTTSSEDSDISLDSSDSSQSSDKPLEDTIEKGMGDIKEMLDKFYFRKNEEDTPPDLPDDETHEKKS